MILSYRLTLSPSYRYHHHPHHPYFHHAGLPLWLRIVTRHAAPQPELVADLLHPVLHRLRPGTQRFVVHPLRARHDGRLRRQVPGVPSWIVLPRLRHDHVHALPSRLLCTGTRQ